GISAHSSLSRPRSSTSARFNTSNGTDLRSATERAFWSVSSNTVEMAIKRFVRRKMFIMTRVQTLEDEISKLSAAEFAELRNWLLERDWEEWDRQIERDSASGK